MRNNPELTRAVHLKAIFAIIATVLILLVALPSTAQITKLREVTDEITDIGERVLLRVEKSRLRIFFKSLERKVDIFNDECESVEVGTYAYENCKIRFQRLEKERLTYNTDAKAFNTLVEASIKKGSAAADEDSGNNTSGDPAPGAIPVKISIHRGTIFRARGRSLGAPLLPGEEIRTSPDARVEILFSNGDAIILDGNTTFQIIDDKKNAIGNIEFIKGRIISIITCFQSREVCRKLSTVRANMAVRGTIYDLEVAEDGSLEIVVLEGIVDVTSRLNGSLTSVGEGQRLRMPGKSGSLDLEDFDPAEYQRWW